MTSTEKTDSGKRESDPDKPTQVDIKPAFFPYKQKTVKTVVTDEERKDYWDGP